MYFCVYRDLAKRVCIAGGNPLLIESPSEPKWSPKGILFSAVFVCTLDYFKNANYRYGSVIITSAKYLCLLESTSKFYSFKL